MKLRGAVGWVCVTAFLVLCISLAAAYGARRLPQLGPLRDLYRFELQSAMGGACGSAVPCADPYEARHAMGILHARWFPVWTSWGAEGRRVQASVDAELELSLQKNSP